MTGAQQHAAIILAGGRSTRLGGLAKADLVIAGRTLLAHTVASAQPAVATIVVGPSADVAHPVTFVQERPPHGGPVRGLATGLAALHQILPHAPGTLPILALACDLPGAKAAIASLLRALAGAPAREGAIAVDPDGVAQPLLGCYRLAPLRRELARTKLSGEGKTASLRRIVNGLDLISVGVSAHEAHDIDTWEQAKAAGASPAQTRRRMP